MRKISADYIFLGSLPPIKKGVVILNGNGLVLEVLNPKKDEINWEEVEQYNGIICPGFINTHCHLELSYLKGKIKEGTHLHGFIKEINSVRNNFVEEERQEAISKAEIEMLNNGIVAVGDISNGGSTFEIKEQNKIKYHTFIEVFGSDPNIATSAYNHSENLFNNYYNSNRVSITPHATYSVSDNLVNLIDKHCKKTNNLISIHNQETKSENKFFKKGAGKMFELLEIDKKHNGKYKSTGKNALPSFLGKFNTLNKILLVHNTFTSKKDIEWANNYSKNIYWCFCPNANLYIENALPNFDLFINEQCTIGTDSLASNNSLSILDELKTISKNYPNIPLQTLIKWATFNGAAFLNFKQLGSIGKGKKPGINLIENIDLEEMKLKTNSKIKALIKIS